MSGPVSTDGQVRCEVDGEIATLTLDRPAKHNALSDPMWEQLEQQSRALGERDDIRIIVVRGEGSVFSAGADLRDLVAATTDEPAARAFCERIAGALHALATVPPLTVAALSHHVRGGGAEVALACDLRVATDDVRFQIPVARLGVVPDRFTARRLLSLGGPAVARRVLMLAEELDAATCHRLGLVDEVVPTGSLDDAIEAVVQRVRPNAPSALRATKTLLSTLEGVDADRGALVAEFVRSLVDGPVRERGERALQPR